VSDSDVVIHLAKLNKLDLIKELYECAHIPRYVELEMVRSQYDEVSIIEEAVRHGVLKVYKTDDSKARSIAGRYGIHVGEAHVKVLAEELHTEVFLSNERKVRIAAKKEGFFCCGHNRYNPKRSESRLFDQRRSDKIAQEQTKSERIQNTSKYYRSCDRFA